MRWLKFNAVGMAGAVVQLAALAVLTRFLSVGYLWASAAAVEIAVLHNFFWHEHWTWRDRLATGSRRSRLARFHLANGLVSIVSNLLLMRWLAGSLHFAIVPANAISILITSCANFALGEVFGYGRYWERMKLTSIGASTSTGCPLSKVG